MLENIFQTIVFVAVITGFIYLVNKRSHLRTSPLTVVRGTYKKGFRSLKTNFKTLKGSKIYGFRLRKHVLLTFYYDVTVEEGALHMRVSSNSETFFRTNIY